MRSRDDSRDMLTGDFPSLHRGLSRESSLLLKIPRFMRGIFSFYR